tara:strand:+ start:21785 stop:23056 length:1272 start_codon:yes stop_codon:yes gene_type:complete
MKKQRKRLSNSEATLLGIQPKPQDKKGENTRYMITSEQFKKIKEHRRNLSTLKNEVKSETKANDYESKPFVLSAFSDDGKMMGIDDYCRAYNLIRKDISSWKLITHTGTPYYNIVFKENKEDLSSIIDIDFIEEIAKKHIKPVELKQQFTFIDSSQIDRIVYTDVHIGMCTDKVGTALYASPWNKERLTLRMEEMCDYTLSRQKSQTLHIDELGDLLDGWDGYTTRGGHKLPQNMTNKEAFDAAIDFKVKMIDYLIPYYSKIVCNNICNDNHAGDFGYIANQTFKFIIEQKYLGSVEVTNHVKFINHYNIGRHGIVITHGKDDKSLKFGFKPHLDPKQIEKIDQYLKQYGVYKFDFIEFGKGDSHQLLLDYSTSDDFDYFNFHAFSPSSEWVQTNFKKGVSGFTHVSMSKESNIKIVTPYFFN